MSDISMTVASAGVAVEAVLEELGGLEQRLAGRNSPGCFCPCAATHTTSRLRIDRATAAPVSISAAAAVREGHGGKSAGQAGLAVANGEARDEGIRG